MQTNEQAYFDQALTNGTVANEAFLRSHCFCSDATDDNYLFMVMTTFMFDNPLFEGKMREILTTETQLTLRVGRLPDTYSFCKKGFENERRALLRLRLRDHGYEIVSGLVEMYAVVSMANPAKLLKAL